MTTVIVIEEFGPGDWRGNVQFGGLEAKGADLTATSLDDMAAQISALLAPQAQPVDPPVVDDPPPVVDTPPADPPIDTSSSDGSDGSQVDAAPAPKVPGLQPGATPKPGPGNMPHTPMPPATPTATPATPVQSHETTLEWIEEHLHIPGHPLPPKKS